MLPAILYRVTRWRPLEDTTTAMLWKTLFATIGELSLRSGLVTEEELTPPLVVPTGSEMAQPREPSQEVASQGRMEDGTDEQELGEESEYEEDPFVCGAGVFQTPLPARPSLRWSEFHPWLFFRRKADQPDFCYRILCRNCQIDPMFKIFGFS